MKQHLISEWFRTEGELQPAEVPRFWAAVGGLRLLRTSAGIQVRQGTFFWMGLLLGRSVSNMIEEEVRNETD